LIFARNFFSEREQQVIVNAIASAESKTSGEIRVHIENFCFGNEVLKAQKIFTHLNMQNTLEHNGVLIYIATVSRKVAVIGDSGIHAKLGQEFWNEVVQEMILKFREGRKAEALAECIIECGEQLGKYFPRSSDDKDELSNNISF
jgi:uncharacterized membrane protein